MTLAFLSPVHDSSPSLLDTSSLQLADPVLLLKPFLPVLKLCQRLLNNLHDGPGFGFSFLDDFGVLVSGRDRIVVSTLCCFCRLLPTKY